MAKTQLMTQYLAIKEEYKDALLLFQMGDFFECFYEDAEIVADTLNIVLTSRSKNKDSAPPMAGFPIKALDDYLPKLVKAGYKVAVAKQVEDPRQAKGIVKRAVTEVITQGTIASQEDLLSDNKNYIACICNNKKNFGLAFADISTGELKVYQDVFVDENVKEILERLAPREILKSTKDTDTDTTELNTVIQPIDASYFETGIAKDAVLSHFNIPNLSPIGLDEYELATIATGVLLTYIKDTKKTDPKHISQVEFFTPKTALHIDPTTQRNLEIFYNLKTHKTDGSLIGVIDETRSAMGHRLLYEWLSFPEMDKNVIEKRYDAVETFIKDSSMYQDLANGFHKYPDIQRLTSSLGLGRIHPKQLLVMAQAIESGLAIYNIVSRLSLSAIGQLREDELESLNQLKEKINSTITNEQGRATFFAEGYSEELDRLVELSTNGEKYIKELYEKEKTDNDLQGLKLSFNNVFGYSFELSKVQSINAPEHFVKKQTLVNSERFITEELKKLEGQVLSSRDQSKILEGELYTKTVTELQEFIKPLIALGNILAKIDVLLGFATLALSKRYSRPTLTTTKRKIELEQMRHPVVEQTVGEFVPNNMEIEKDSNFLILTGPNMGGKSTFVRQIALIQIMAQIGSFIPASKATLPLVDKVFARIGASDDISTGRSTFMVELSEVAYIVSQATPNSLVILDEVGRGTSTYEGISLAWGVAQYIANQIGCTTIFTTHFRELTDLEDISSKFINYKVNLKEADDTIYFLHTVTRGRSDKSYGIQVARLVNLPDEIIDTAFSVLDSFESKALPVSVKTTNKPRKLQVTPTSQMDLFTTAGNDKLERLKKLEELLKDADPNNMTPLEALMLVEKMKNE